MKENNENNIEIENTGVTSNIKSISQESIPPVEEKSPNKKSNKKIVIFIAAIVIVIVVIGFLLFVLGTKDDKSTSDNNGNTSTSSSTSITTRAITEEKRINISEEDLKLIKSGTNYKFYNLSTKNSLNKGKSYATLDNDITICLDVIGKISTDDEVYFYKLDFYISDKLAFTMVNSDDYNGLRIYTIGNYIIVNENIAGTYLRAEHHVVYDNNGNLIKDLKDFNSDNISGMVVGEGYEDFVYGEIGIYENEIVFIGTRYVDASSLAIGNEEYYFMCDGGDDDDIDYHVRTIETLKKLSPNLAVKSEYHYEIHNGEIDFNNPKIKVIETLDDVIKANTVCEKEED